MNAHVLILSENCCWINYCSLNDVSNSQVSQHGVLCPSCVFQFNRQCFLWNSCLTHVSDDNN